MACMNSFILPTFRHSFVSLSLVFTFLSAFSCSCRASQVPVPVTIQQGDVPGTVVQDNFLGISFELYPFNTLWGESPQQMPTAMENYLSNLRARIESPLRIRIGGNSMDSAVYVPTQTEMIVVTGDPAADPDDVPVDFGPMLFKVLDAMGNVVGQMEFIVGLSMRSSNYTNAVEVAGDTRKILGHRLDAMLLGNEPDLYASNGVHLGYTIQEYITDVGTMLQDLRNSPYGDLIPDTIVGGPTICCDWNLSDVLSAGLSQYPYKYYTVQHYAKSICSGPNASNENITYFVSHVNVPMYTNWQKQGVQMANDARTPVLVTEYNTVSCGGSNVSDTFAATLWAIDAGLNYASSGMSGAYIHTREYGILYNLFDPPSPETSTEPNWRTGSPYYAALFLSETFIAGGSIVVDLNLNNSIYDPAATVAGYALYDKAGTKAKRLVFFNYYRADDAGSESAARNFTLEGGLATTAGVRILAAPSIYERTDISWAGQTVGLNGELDGTQTTKYHYDCAMGCNITVPGPGAALVLLDDVPDDSAFFFGSSAVAPLS
ncbi:hypothetical protein EV401DRAFT_2013993 [Pisolithus croceorrhizus]|nr:hypothetical protein EV401DRAFT_2013993 [Pisolithus croceorrhizus]